LVYLYSTVFYFARFSSVKLSERNMVWIFLFSFPEKYSAGERVFLEVRQKSSAF